MHQIYYILLTYLPPYLPPRSIIFHSAILRRTSTVCWPCTLHVCTHDPCNREPSTLIFEAPTPPLAPPPPLLSTLSKSPLLRFSLVLIFLNIYYTCTCIGIIYISHMTRISPPQHPRTSISQRSSRFCFVSLFFSSNYHHHYILSILGRASRRGPPASVSCPSSSARPASREIL